MTVLAALVLSALLLIGSIPATLTISPGYRQAVRDAVAAIDAGKGGIDGQAAIPVGDHTIRVHLGKHASQKHLADAWECRHGLEYRGPQQIRRSREFPNRYIMLGTSLHDNLPCVMVVQKNKDRTWRELTSFILRDQAGYLRWLLAATDLVAALPQ